MTMRDLVAYKENKIKENALKWNADKQENGSCKGLTDREYNKIQTKQKTTRSRNNGYFKPTFVNRIRIK